jgi:hypothetical protein
MSRRLRKNNRAVETEDPVVSALHYVAQIPTFLHAWRSPDEIGRIIGHVFDIPRGKKDELTPTLLHKHISSDPCTGPGVDMTDGFNTTGIFRRAYQFKNEDGKNVKARYLFLCSNEETPPKPKPKHKWYADIRILATGWDKERRGLNENDPKKYETIRDCLLELLTELRRKNEKNEKKGKTATQTSRSILKEKRAQDKGPAAEPTPKKTKLIQTESQRIAELLRQVLNEPNRENVEPITRSDACSLLHLTLQIIVPTVSNMVGGRMSLLEAEKVLIDYQPEADDMDSNRDAEEEVEDEQSSEDEEDRDKGTENVRATITPDL